MEISSQLQALAGLTPLKNLGTHYVRASMAWRVNLECFGEGEIFFSCWESNPEPHNP
jgi:hypothetical protein